MYIISYNETELIHRCPLFLSDSNCRSIISSPCMNDCYLICELCSFGEHQLDRFLGDIFHRTAIYAEAL